MMPRLRISLSPASRVAIGLVSLMLTLLLMADVVTGVLPSRLAEAKRAREATAELLATRLTTALNAGHVEQIGALLASSMTPESSLQGGALLTADGQVLAQRGNHAKAWTLLPAEPSTLDNIRVPIIADERPWGELQLVFAPALPLSLGYWLRDPLVQAIIFVTVFAFIAFHLYLRRMMRYMDPNAAVPERVRTAFDTLSEGVLVLDPEGAIMLANRAFKNLLSPGVGALTGLNASSLEWLVEGLPAKPELPWTEAMRSKLPQLGLPLRVQGANGANFDLVMNCSPIDDGRGRVRGCLATFSDVTELHERTEGLRVALEALSASQREIELKNEELTLQATRDPLTGCLNRRAFMELAERRFAEASPEAAPLCCIMCDIDHFKSINDQFGHALGDRVIQASVKCLNSGLRGQDLLGRYGGEEFCILLPHTSRAQAFEVAERLRHEVDTHVGDALRQPSRPKVTMSFGVAEWTPGVESPAALIDLADQALYRSKQGGRNRVT